jgi:hypothetical protein
LVPWRNWINLGDEPASECTDRGEGEFI